MSQSHYSSSQRASEAEDSADDDDEEYVVDSDDETSSTTSEEDSVEKKGKTKKQDVNKLHSTNAHVSGAINDKEEGNEERSDSDSSESSTSDSSSDGSTHSNNKGANRNKKRCPLKGCRAFVIHLPRHMRKIHKWSEHESRNVLTVFGLRKERMAKRKRSVKQCPMSPCLFKGPRLDNHLVFQHGFKRGNEGYLQLLKNATVVKAGNKKGVKHLKRSRNAQSSSVAEKRGEGPRPSTSSAQDESFSIARKRKAKHHSSEHLKAKQSRHVQSSFIDKKKEKRQGSGPVPITLSPEHKSNVSETGTLELFSDTDSDESSQSDESFESELSSEESKDGSNADSKLLVDFLEWLQSPDGGKRELKNAKQYVSQVRKILHKMRGDDDQTTIIETVLDKAKLKMWIKGMEKAKPGTVKSYMISLKMFLSFLIVDHDIGDKEMKVARQRKELLINWSKSLNKSSKQRFWDKRLEDMRKRIKPEQIKKFEQSEAARKAISILGRLSEEGSQDFSQKQFCLVRDFLMTEVLINNAQRSGCISNLTVAEFRQALNESEHSVAMVKNHKTSHVYGPASLVLSPTLKQWMSIYYANLRMKIQTSKDCFFITYQGNALSSSSVSSAINSIWVKSNAGRADQGRVSATSFRKAAVSQVYSTNKEMKYKLADLMTHDPKTAEKYYSLEEKSMQNINTSKQLSKILRGVGQSTSKVSEGKPTEEESPEKSPEDEAISKKQGFTQDRVDAMKQLFEKNISGRAITLDEVREGINGHPLLSTESPKRIYDRIRSEWRFSKDETEVSLPEETETFDDKVERLFKNTDNNDGSGSITSSTSVKTVFSEDERKLLVTVCKDMVNGASVTMDNVREQLHSDPHAKTLLERFTFKQLINKVRFERAQKKKGKR